MEFKSKAQMRAAFASRPRIAKKWADESQRKGINLKDLPKKIDPSETIPKSEYGTAFKSAGFLKEMEQIGVFCV
jgi:hypothetical protein